MAEKPGGTGKAIGKKVPGASERASGLGLHHPGADREKEILIQLRFHQLEAIS